MSRLPDFIVVGAQRAGTTSFYDHLTRHPKVAPADRKETHFFSLFWDNGESWYRARFPGGRFSRTITGEATPYYLFHPAAPDRAKATCPDARFVVLLRNPIDRAFSQYQHSRKLGFEPLTFAEAIAREQDRLRGEEERILADPGYHSVSHQNHSYVARGHYADQLERWMQRFERSRFLILRSEDFFADPGVALERTFAFLDLAPATLEGLERLNASAYTAAIDEGLRDELASHFRPHNARLYDLLGIDLRWT